MVPNSFSPCCNSMGQFEANLQCDYKSPFLAHSIRNLVWVFLPGARVGNEHIQKTLELYRTEWEKAMEEDF